MSALNIAKISDNKVSTVCGVDALYYHLKINFQHYSTFYKECVSSNIMCLGAFTRISENWTKQYTYFKLVCPFENVTIARIGFKNLNTRDNLESVSVQMDSYYMNTHGIETSYHTVVEHIESLGLQVGRSKISRADLNTFVYGYDFSYLEYFYFSTLIRSNTKIYSGAKDKLQTFYLGNRTSTGAPFMRIYDKWAELLTQDVDNRKTALINHRFVKENNVYLEQDTPLWNVEFELKREFFKTYSIDTVEDFLCSVNVLHSELMKRIRLMTKKRKIDENHTDRIPTAPVWEMIANNYNFNDSNVPLDKIIPVKYSKDIEWLLNRVEEYKKVQSDTLTDNEILLLISQKLRQLDKEQKENN